MSAGDANKSQVDIIALFNELADQSSGLKYDDEATRDALLRRTQMIAAKVFGDTSKSI